MLFLSMEAAYVKSVGTESSSRISGDTSLSTSISNESSLRISNDLSLSTSILSAGGLTTATNGLTVSGTTLQQEIELLKNK